MCNNLNAEWGCLENGWRSNALVNFSQTILLDRRWRLTAKFVGGRSHCDKVPCVSWDGTMAGADLGHSSNYSNELQFVCRPGWPMRRAQACKTLKSVVRKVFWRVAINSELVDPKCWAKADRRTPTNGQLRATQKGNRLIFRYWVDFLRNGRFYKGASTALETAKSRRKLKICLPESRRVFFSLYQRPLLSHKGRAPVKRAPLLWKSWASEMNCSAKRLCSVVKAEKFHKVSADTPARTTWKIQWSV